MLVGVGHGRRDLFQDRLVERGHAGVARFVVEMALPFLDREAELGRGVNGGEVELLVGGVELEEELENHVEHLVGAGVLAVDLVDDDDRLGPDFERLAQDEFRLGLGAVEGVHDQEHAVDHLENALHLAAEIGVAGGVDDVHVVVVILEGRRSWP